MNSIARQRSVLQDPAFRLSFVWLLIGVVCAALLSSCAISLAPAYDADLLEGLNSANQETLVLFTKLEPGSDKADFDKFDDAYAQAIATFEALEQRADARPFPPLTARITKLKFLSGVCNPSGDPKTCLDATDHALKEIGGTLRMMRQTHRNAGLPADLVRNFRDRFNTNMHNALTIETALKR